MKKVVFIFLIICFMQLSTISFSNAESDIKVLLNGNQLSFDIKPKIINGRTLVPLRGIFEALGIKVDWDNSTKTITATKDTINIILTLNIPKGIVNNKVVTLDVPPTSISGRTLVPLRFISENFNLNVDWDNNNKIIYIKNKTVVPIIENINLSKDYFENKEENYKIKFPENWIVNKREKQGNLFWTESYPNSDIHIPIFEVFSLKNTVKADLDTTVSQLLPSLVDSFTKGQINLKEISREVINLSNKKAIWLEYDGEVVANGQKSIMNAYAILTVSENNIYFIWALSENNYWKAYKEILKSSINSFTIIENSVSNSTLNNSKIETKEELIKFLETNFSELNTCLGTAKFTFEIYENTSTFEEYDYWIQVGYDYNFFEGAMYSIKYTNEQKNKLKQELKDFQEKIGRAVVSAMPNKKFYGGYYDSWYKYPNLKMDLQTRRYYSWINYEKPDILTSDIKNSYYNTKPSDFRWWDFIDDKL